MELEVLMNLVLNVLISVFLLDLPKGENILPMMGDSCVWELWQLLHVCVCFYPLGLGLFIKTDDNKSRSGGPCSELWGNT